MRVIEAISKPPCISLEFFPPKDPAAEKTFFERVTKLKSIKPAFVSVTYGAGGSSKDETHSITTKLDEDKDLVVLPHLTCIAQTEEQLLRTIGKYRQEGKENVLALRGDIPEGSNIDPEESELPHAVDLIKLIRSNFGTDFCVGGAAMPEGHPESRNKAKEMDYFRMKVDAGMEFAITQMFFDNSYFYEFMDKCGKYGIDMPIVPGIMPITNFPRIRKFAEACNATIPASLAHRMEKHVEDKSAMSEIGTDFAVEQCMDLIDNGIKRFHIFTLNRAKCIIELYDRISDRLRN